MVPLPMVPPKHLRLRYIEMQYTKKSKLNNNKQCNAMLL